MSDPRDVSERVVSAGVRRPLVTGFALTLGGLAAYALGTAVTQLSTVLIAIAFALFAALGLDPLVQRLEARHMTRPWAIVIVYAAFALVAAGVLLLVVPTVVTQVAQIVSGMPTWVADVKKSPLSSWLDTQFGSDWGSLLSQLTSFLTQPSHAATIGKGVLAAGATIAGTVSSMIVAVVLSLYFLAALPVMKQGLARLTPARMRGTVTSMTDEIAASIGAYLSGMVVLALCNAVVAFTLHLVLHLPFPLLMGLAAFCITLIPLVGSVLYWGVASALALFTGWMPALIFAVIYLAYMQLEAYVLTPKVMNRAISVPGSLVVIGALVGGTLLGLLGALVAIPVTAAILLIVKRVFIPRQDASV